MKDDNSSKMEPWQKAETWQSLAIAAAIITPVLAAFSVPWIVAGNGDVGMLRRVQIVAAGVTFGFAAVTFFTVIWRGLISTHQAKLQREQLDRLAEQLAETSKNNLASLLQEGAELLSEVGKPAKISAGLATLHAVASDTNDKFATQALNLIAEFVQDNGAENHADKKVQTAIEAINSVFRETRRHSTFRLQFVGNGRTDWRIVEGTRFSYRGGNITNEELAIEHPMDIGPMSFVGVRFQRCVINARPGILIRECEFVDCDILGISGFALNKNQFHRCDFSGAVLRAVTDIPDLRADRNWFSPEAPPTIRGRQIEGLADLLLEGRPVRQIAQGHAATSPAS